jgi:hypothetical protein
MAPRKHRRETRTAKIDAAVHPRLAELQAQLAGQDLPSYVDHMEILSALLLYATPEQLAGMLRGYWRYTSRLRQPGDPRSRGRDPD